MKIRQLIKAISDSIILDDFEVKGLSCNSKTVSDNFIFVAIKGDRDDGNNFIDEAIQKGAKAVIVQSPVKNFKTGHRRQATGDRVSFIEVQDTRRALAELAAEFYNRTSSKIKVVGVTGTNGKTTVAYLIESLLKETHSPVGVIGTINYRFKDKVFPAKNTTPGPVELQSILADMENEGIKYCILETSSHALDQDRTVGIDFGSAIFTNLTQDHLDYHITLENYFSSKAKLFRNINKDSTAIINTDDKFGSRMKEITKARIISYGIQNKAIVSAKDIKFDISHTRLRLVCPRGELILRSPLIGRHNVYNVLAAVSWAQEEGIELSTIKSIIEDFTFVPGRLEKIVNKKDFTIFVDYAHTEDALKNVLTALRGLSGNRIIVVFGCGGERDKTKRPKMGRIVSELSDYAIITNDNPRSDDPLEIIEDIKKGIEKTNFCVILERRKAIEKALALAKSGDMVLVAGKGHEDYQILKDRTLHFDDREVIRECLKSMNY